MKIFKEKEKISRKEFRDIIRKRNPIVPGTYRKLFSFKEKKEMEKKLFGKRIGSEATKEKFKRLIREIGRDKYKAKDLTKKRIIDKKIRFLKRLGGV